MSHENPEDLEPRTLYDPKLKPTPVSNQRSRKMSSCCCYFTIILMICIACLAVMAGVGGIVYLEIFASSQDKDIEKTNASVENDDPSAPKEIFQHTTYKQDNVNQNEPIIPENVLKDIIKNSIKLAENIDASRKITVATSKPNDIFHNEVLTYSKNSKAKELNNIKNGLVSENQDMELTEHPDIAELSDVARNIHARFNNFKVPMSDKSVEVKSNSKNQDSVDLNLNLQSIYNIGDKTLDGHSDNINAQMTKNRSTVIEKSNSKELLDSSEETLVFGRNLNFEETTSLQGNELKSEQEKVISSQNLLGFHLLPDNSIDHTVNSNNDNFEDNSFDNETHSNSHDPEDDSFDNREHAIDHDPGDNSSDHRNHAIDRDSEDNSFDHSEYSTNHGIKNNSLNRAEHSTVFNDKSLNDHNEDSSDFDSNNSSSDEHSKFKGQDQDSDDSTQLLFIRPIVESKAVPVPLAFLRRIGFDIKNPNSHQPMSAKDMDIKFSLAEALKYLRSLDTDNKLPVSREKTTTRKTSNQKESKKTKLPVKSEREEYLNHLRKQIFEESS
ncbi:unnamed protein product [Larinioides sclopetarius]